MQQISKGIKTNHSVSISHIILSISLFQHALCSNPAWKHENFRPSPTIQKELVRFLHSLPRSLVMWQAEHQELIPLKSQPNSHDIYDSLRLSDIRRIRTCTFHSSLTINIHVASKLCSEQDQAGGEEGGIRTTREMLDKKKFTLSMRQMFLYLRYFLCWVPKGINYFWKSDNSCLALNKWYIEIQTLGIPDANPTPI